MSGIEEFLLNVFFVLVPIFLYQTFFIEHVNFQNVRLKNVTVSLLGAASLILCMTFPFNVLPGYIYDLRAIPLIITILYIGYVPGIFLTVILVVYRYYLGGGGFVVAMADLATIWIGAVLAGQRYRHYSRRGKTLAAMAVVLASSIVVGAITFFREIDAPRMDLAESEFLQFVLLFSFFNAFAIWMVVFLIETIRENAVMQQEMQRSEKMHVLGELAASIAHEIRNPMTVARGFVQLMLERQIEPEKQKMYMQMVIDELDRSHSIINDYLSFAKPQMEKIEKVDVRQRIQHSMNVMSSFANLRGVEMVEDTEEHLYIATNPEKLSQVLMNLIKNGIEAMPNGGTLRIHARRSRVHVVIDIIDTGIGMSPGEVERLGSPFYSTKESGTGLGLMVCYRIVEAANGKIHVTSEKGKGTQISITMPLA